MFVWIWLEVNFQLRYRYICLYWVVHKLTCWNTNTVNNIKHIIISNEFEIWKDLFPITHLHVKQKQKRLTRLTWSRYWSIQFYSLFLQKVLFLIGNKNYQEIFENFVYLVNKNPCHKDTKCDRFHHYQSLLH